MSTSPSSRRPPELVAPLWRGPIQDVTTYGEGATPDDRRSFHGQILVRSADDTGQRSGRAMVARSFQGRYLSITLRGKGDARQEAALPAYQPRGTNRAGLSASRFAGESEAAPGYGIARGRLCNYLTHCLFPHSKAGVGLVLVAGATGSSKSNIARGIVNCYLEARLEEVQRSGNDDAPRRPHLLTVEQPIEEYLYQLPDGNPAPPRQTQESIGLDYTPREIGVDVDDLRTALIVDALRQTPSIVYVGELRSSADLRTALEFAATGHLIVSTMHAGSLVEAMDRLFTARKVRSAADRGQTASLVRGLIHVRMLEIEGLKVLAPALWKGTHQGVASVVADGLSAILPHRISISARSASENDEVSCIGRTALVEGLMESNAAPDVIDRQAVMLRLLEQDLGGV